MPHMDLPAGIREHLKNIVLRRAAGGTSGTAKQARLSHSACQRGSAFLKSCRISCGRVSGRSWAGNGAGVGHGHRILPGPKGISRGPATGRARPLPCATRRRILRLLLPGPRCASSSPCCCCWPPAPSALPNRAGGGRLPRGLRRRRAGCAAPLPRCRRHLRPRLSRPGADAAFALARDAAGRSAWGYVGGAATDRRRPRRRRSSAAGARSAPLQAECRILARDAGRPGGPAAVPLAEGSSAPSAGRPLLLRRGPQAARGVLVWGHGYGGPDRDNRTGRHRPSSPSSTTMAGTCCASTATRAMTGSYQPAAAGGWPGGAEDGRLSADPARRPVARRLAGHHGGGERPDLVDAVIATAPAAHGEWSRGNNLGAAIDDFRAAGRGAGGAAPGGGAVRRRRLRPRPRRRAALLEARGADRRAPTLALGPSRPCAAMRRRASCASPSATPAACSAWCRRRSWRPRAASGARPVAAAEP